MMSPERLLSRHPLKNGLTLEFWDLSRQAAGDRWQVVCEARVVVPVIVAHLPPELQPKLAEVTGALGPEVTFAKQEVRNFVAEGEMVPLLQKMQSWLLRSLETYLSHREFALRFIARKFNDFKERQRWCQI